MTIILDAPVDTTEIVEHPSGNGDKRITPRSADRTYERADGTVHRSISSLPWPTDHSGSTRFMAGQYVAANIADVAATPIDEIPKKVAMGAEGVLNAHANRGTALHRYIECQVLGITPDWDELERTDAHLWVPAADNYLRANPPGEGLNEVWTFGESCGHRIAGTPDRVDLGDVVTLIDYKSRTPGSGHQRRAHEAAQLGAYAWNLTHGCYVDDRGYDRTLERIDACVVITFCPDGSWKPHSVDVDVALRAHEARMAFLDLDASSMFHGPNKINGPTAAECFQAELDAMRDEDKMALAALWREHAMPRIAELEPHHYITARRLFMQAGPFAGPEPHVAPLATDQQRDDIRRRLAALPDDIAQTVLDGAR